jgi:hypothetical protein
VGRGAAKPLVELCTELRAKLLQGFGRAWCRAFAELLQSFGRAFAELCAEVRAELLRSFCRAFAELRVKLYIEFRVERYIGMQTFL